jgi:transcription antitermination factor NusG
MSETHEQWFAVRVKSNFERTTSLLLREKGYEEFLPTYRSKRSWSDRVKETSEPLFPGYLFCRFNVGQRFPVLATPGVVHVVSVGRKPVPVETEEIEALQRIVQSGVGVQRWPFLRVGQSVIVEQGPLAGVEGILTGIKDDFRIVVSVQLLQRSVAAEIDGNWIRPAKSAARPTNLGSEKSAYTPTAKPVGLLPYF